MKSEVLRESIKKIDFYRNSSRRARELADTIVRMENDAADLRDRAKNTDDLYIKSSRQATADHTDECRTSILISILCMAAHVNEKHKVVQDEMKILSVSSTSRDIAMSIERCLEFSRKMELIRKRKRILRGVKWLAAGLIIGAINTATILWVGLKFF